MDEVSAPRTVIREAKRLLDCYYEGHKAWVVGSRATGEHREDSDLDVVVEKQPTRRKNPDGNTGCGRYVADAACGIDVDITEDPDGPVRGEEHTAFRLQ